MQSATFLYFTIKYKKNRIEHGVIDGRLFVHAIFYKENDRDRTRN